MDEEQISDGGNDVMFLGVDPGSKGGSIAFIDEEGRAIRVMPIPVRDRRVPFATIKVEVDAIALYVKMQQFLRLHNPNMVIAVIEEPISGGRFSQMAIPHAENYAIIRTVVELLSANDSYAGVTMTVPPRTWKAGFKLLKGKPTREEGKQRSLRLAKETFPGYPIGNDHNAAEALLLAEYGRLQHATQREDTRG